MTPKLNRDFSSKSGLISICTNKTNNNDNTRSKEIKNENGQL